MSRRLAFASFLAVSAAATVRAQTEIDLAVVPADIHVVGAGDFDEFAASILSDDTRVAVGDLDGDGYIDLVLGAHGAEPEAARYACGAVYVQFGPLRRGTRLELATAAADLTVYGQDLEDRFGHAVAVGDVDGDHIDDLIVTAPLADGPGNTRDLAGAVYVLFGRRSWPPTIDLATPGAELVIHGARDRSSLGGMVTTGDLDDDGIQDIVAPGAGIILGRRSWPPAIDLAVTAPDVELTAIIGAVATGDIDSDGFDDLELSHGNLSTDGRSLNGRVQVLLGRASWPPTIDLTVTPPDLEIVGASGNGLGSGLAVGDLDGDGREDLAVGARFHDGLAGACSGCGAVAVWRGRGSWPARIDLLSEPSDAIVYGSGAGDGVGSAIAIGDHDADGIGDLMAGAAYGSGPGDARRYGGEGYIVHGPFVGVRELGSTPPELVLFGAIAGDQLGKAVAAADLDADGASDLVAGLKGHEINPFDTKGEAVVILAPLGPTAGSLLRIAHLDSDPPRVAEAFAAVPCAIESDVTVCAEAPGRRDRRGVSLPARIRADARLALFSYDADTTTIGPAAILLVTKDALVPGRVLVSRR